VPSINHRLEDWNAISEEDWPALLLGNGGSIAVWNDFSYAALFDNAPLTDEDCDLFEALGDTSNFEVVLDALRVSRIVCGQLGHAAVEVTDRYESIKEALIATVNEVHIPWTEMPERVLDSIGSILPESQFHLQ
jgi:hypothetical protein